MLQLDFFPRMEFKTLADFQRLEGIGLSESERRLLTSIPGFFTAPKANDVIRKQHAKLVDGVIGFRQRYVEEMLVAEAQGFEPEGPIESWGPSLHKGVQTWVGLDLQTLQTPYSECLRILQLLKIKPYEHIIDLGAAYGRMGIVIGGLYLKNSFTGYEFVEARVAEGNRIYRELGFQRCLLQKEDLSDPGFKLQEADVYFIYDYGQVEHINHTLLQIERISRKRPVRVVVRGKYTKDIIKASHPWLILRYEGKFEEMFSIFSAYRP